MTKQIIIWTVSVVLFAGIAFCTIWTITNFDKVRQATSGTNIYDASDLDNAYRDGYDKALKDKDDYMALIDEYRDTIAILTDNISQLNTSIGDLQTANELKQTTINTLIYEREQCDIAIAYFQGVIAGNNTTIADLNAQIDNLNGQIAILNGSGANRDTEIVILWEQINNLQGVISQLENTNAGYLASINSLNAQISNLNATIISLLAQLEQNNNTIAELNARILELENSLSYYAGLLDADIDENKVVATFIFNGIVYNVQVLARGGRVAVVDPTSTDLIAFEYWTLDGENYVDINSYEVYENTTFIAKITTYYNVAFMVDGQVIDNQAVLKDNALTYLPPDPFKDDYVFKGWSTDGATVIDIYGYQITHTTTLIAVFNQMFTVDFIMNLNLMETQSVESGTYATYVVIMSTNFVSFSGWTLDGENVIDVESYVITADTTFIAKVINYYKFTYIVDGEIYALDYVRENNSPYYTPDIPFTMGHYFLGWSNFETNVVDLTTYTATQDEIFTAIFSNEIARSFITLSCNGETVLSFDIFSDGTMANFTFGAYFDNYTYLANMGNDGRFLFFFYDNTNYDFYCVEFYYGLTTYMNGIYFFGDSLSTDALELGILVDYFDLIWVRY